MLNIALVVGFLDNEFSMAIIDGAWNAAQELGVNLYIISSRLLIPNYSAEELNRFKYQYNTMLSYIDKGNFDGVVMETGVICNGMPDEEVKKLFDSFGIPVVSVARKIEGYPSIRFSSSGLRDELQHLIDVHGCRRIGFIGGPRDNGEAIERFELYKKTLEDNGIAFDEKLYGMGNFSEFCEDEVKRVLTQNEGNIDALCFANDRMAIGGYLALETMGLIPGKDISVIGFDDAPSASAMDPPLTTVHSNIPFLGEKAVKQCFELINGKAGHDVTVDTSTVIRSSCGCPSRANIISEHITAQGALEAMSSEVLCDELRTFLFSSINLDMDMKNAIIGVTDSFLELLNTVDLPAFDSQSFIHKISNKIELLDFEIVPYNEFSFALNLVRQKAIAIAQNRSVVETLFYDIVSRIADGKLSNAYVVRQDYKNLANITSAIIYDVLVHIKNEEISYRSIVTNVHRHNVKSSYLFIHEKPLICRSYHSWVRPEMERLVAYQCGDLEEFLPYEKQHYKSESIFRCPQISSQQGVYIVSPLFHDEQHYGILMAEAGKKDYTYLEWSVIYQVNYALKMKQLMEEQMTVQEQLSKNMKTIESYNALLKQKSISDELTGVFNRRGFIEKVTEMLTDPNNFGRRAAICFTDMNDLKVVNDKFGHDEGDFSIKGVSEILTTSFRASDVVARFGGDEFATFSFIGSDDFEGLKRRTIQDVTAEFNKRSGKPFLVTISIGIYEFTCEEDMQLTDCMNRADELLYEDKKHKPSTILL